MIAVLEIIRCAAAAAIVVLSALYGVVALMIEYRHWEKEFEEDENDDSDERGL